MVDICLQVLAMVARHAIEENVEILALTCSKTCANLYKNLRRTCIYLYLLVNCNSVAPVCNIVTKSACIFVAKYVQRYMDYSNKKKKSNDVPTAWNDVEKSAYIFAV